MNCSETQTLVHAYVDGELDVVHAFDIEQHLRQCSTCAGAYESCKGIRERLKRGGLAFSAPAGLRERIQVALPKSGPAARSRRFRIPGNLAAIAASLLVGVLAGGTAMELFPLRSADNRLSDELLASHVRSQMLTNHQVDVESSDQHTVKPWFKGKLDFSPSVHDLADKGFPLVGGRLDYLDHRPVAALVYQRRKHLINLFMWPIAVGREENPRSFERQGYHFIHWVQSSIDFWAVSDLNKDELNEFVMLVKAKSE